MGERHLWRRAVGVCALVLGAVALSGCVADDYESLESPVGWEEPGWMAQVRQQDEEYVSAMEACYDEYGLESTRTIGAGGVGFVNLPSDPATQELLEKAAADCNERIPRPAHSETQAFDEPTYDRMVAVRECITAHGYETPEPPSFQTWRDTTPSHLAWSPYRALVGPEAAGITDDELRALNDACPQTGPNRQQKVPDAH